MWGGARVDARAEESLRRTYNFNPDRRVWVGDPEGAQAEDFDDQAWRPVTLPYAWNEDEAFKLDIHSLSTGVAWYRKHFRRNRKGMSNTDGTRGVVRRRDF